MKRWHKHSKEMESSCNCSCGKKSGMFGCGYFLGFIGAAMYYISTAASFGAGVVGILKALVWPLVLVYKLFSFLGM